MCTHILNKKKLQGKIANSLLKISHIVKKLRLSTQSTKSKYLCWLWQFIVGRTVTRFKQELGEYTRLNDGRYLITTDVAKRNNISGVKKELYYLAHELIETHNQEWVGQHGDLCIQFSCMDKTSFIERHVHTNEICDQYVISFGEYKGGILHVFCPVKKRFQAKETKNKLALINGNFEHYVSLITSGLRYSIVFFKQYDRRIVAMKSTGEGPSIFYITRNHSCDSN